MLKKINRLGKFTFVPGIILGGLGGFLYWKFVGCSSGACAITSSPINSTLYFAGLGGLVFNSLFPGNKKVASAIHTDHQDNQK